MAIIKPFKIKSFKKKDPSIEFKDVSLGFGNRLILNNINFSINKNTIHGLLGPNGAGKSTLFHLITGLLIPKNGQVKISGDINSLIPKSEKSILSFSLSSGFEILAMVFFAPNCLAK